MASRFEVLADITFEEFLVLIFTTVIHLHISFTCFTRWQQTNEMFAVCCFSLVSSRTVAQIKRASDKGARSQNAEGEDCDGLIDTCATHSISREVLQGQSKGDFPWKFHQLFLQRFCRSFCWSGILRG